jgi:hypothetical protein
MGISDLSSIASIYYNPAMLGLGGALGASVLGSQINRPNKLLPSFDNGKYSIFSEATGETYDPVTSRYMFGGDKGQYNLYPWLGQKRDQLNDGRNIPQAMNATYRDAQTLLKDDPAAQQAFQQRFGSAPKISGMNLPPQLDRKVNWGGQMNGMNLNTVAMKNQAEKQGWGYANDPREVGVLSSWSANQNMPTLGPANQGIANMQPPPRAPFQPNQTVMNQLGGQRLMTPVSPAGQPSLPQQGGSTPQWMMDAYARKIQGMGGNADGPTPFGVNQTGFPQMGGGPAAPQEQQGPQMIQGKSGPPRQYMAPGMPAGKSAPGGQGSNLLMNGAGQGVAPPAPPSINRAATIGNIAAGALGAANNAVTNSKGMFVRR